MSVCPLSVLPRTELPPAQGPGLTAAYFHTGTQFPLPTRTQSWRIPKAASLRGDATGKATPPCRRCRAVSTGRCLKFCTDKEKGKGIRGEHATDFPYRYPLVSVPLNAAAPTCPLFGVLSSLHLSADKSLPPFPPIPPYCSKKTTRVWVMLDFIIKDGFLLPCPPPRGTLSLVKGRVGAQPSAPGRIQAEICKKR